MKLYEIAHLIESEFPLCDAYEWDNVGLLFGDKNKEIKKVLLTLDVNLTVIKEAIDNKVDLILSHHPILWNGIKKINNDTLDGQIVLALAENKIAVYAAHTNCDVGKNGINAKLAELFELNNVSYLEETGLGRIGTLETEMTLFDFANLIKQKLNTPFVRIAGDKNKKIKTVALGSGACWDSTPVAIEKGADVMVTADMKYHNTMNFAEMGIGIIDAGHYPTEIIVMDIFEKILKDSNLTLIKSENTDIFNLV